jgi:hypothetical protein
MRPQAYGVPRNAAPRVQPPAPQQTFSFKTFFADQSINIVASLGAFLILIGSLSFIATTSDLLFACVVLLVVHAIFGIVGAVTYRFAGLRIVSIVYTAIFALQVPLVGFSVYRFVAGSFLHLPNSLLIALAACYATLTYGVLSVYQRFKPFGYLAGVSLIVADLAIASTLHLAIWWWPLMLLLLAFPLQLFAPRSLSSASQTVSRIDVLREPALLLLGFCVVAGAVGALLTTLYSLVIRSGAQGDLRLSIAATTAVLAVWLALFTWYTRRYEFARVVPYLGTACSLAICYALYASRPVYVLSLTVLVALASGLARLDLRIFQQQARAVERHLEILALLLIAILPFVAIPDLFLRILAYVYLQQRLMMSVPPLEIALDVIILLFCCGLTLSMVMRHTGGWRKMLSIGEARWCGLLLLCGFLLNYVLAIVLVTFNLSPVWTMAGFLVLCLALAVCARRILDASWSAPLDVLVLGVFGETILLGFGLDARSSIFLLLSLTALFYGVALYQRQWLLIPFALLCSFIALPHLFYSTAPTLLVLAMLLPFIYIGVQHILASSPGLTTPAPSNQPLRQRVPAWESPLLLMSVVYGISIALYESTHRVGIIQYWLTIPVPVAVELALVALAWYIGGMLGQRRAWTGIAVGLALWSILLVLPRGACEAWIYGGVRSTVCLREGQFALYKLGAIALVAVILGLMIDGIKRAARTSITSFRGLESWPWYLIALEAIGVILVCSELAVLPASDLLAVLCGLTILAVVVMLMKRTPELLILVAILAVRAVWCTPWLFWQRMVALSVLCLLIFAAQFIWRVLIPGSSRVAAARLSIGLALGGQALVVLVILLTGGLSATTGVLVHVGVGSLIVLALLLAWAGSLQTEHTIRWSCLYSAGLLCTLAVPWELAAFTQAPLSTLWLVPASYLIVISPLLTRDGKFAYNQRAGQFSAITGALLLLLPTLWLSFSEQNLQPSLLLTGESLFLLLLGFVLHRRFFILSSVSLVIVTAIHVLFLPSLGIPTFLALSLMGLLLLTLATILVLVRGRLAALWTTLE